MCVRKASALLSHLSFLQMAARTSRGSMHRFILRQLSSLTACTRLPALVTSDNCVSELPWSSTIDACQRAQLRNEGLIDHDFLQRMPIRGIMWVILADEP